MQMLLWHVQFTLTLLQMQKSAKMFRNSFDEHDKEFKFGLQISQISIQSNICRMCWTNLIHRGPTSQITGLKVSAVNVLMPDTTAHLVWSCGVNVSELFEARASPLLLQLVAIMK